MKTHLYGYSLRGREDHTSISLGTVCGGHEWEPDNLFFTLWVMGSHRRFPGRGGTKPVPNFQTIHVGSTINLPDQYTPAHGSDPIHSFFFLMACKLKKLYYSFLLQLDWDIIHILELQFIYFKYVIQCLLAYSQSCATNVTVNFRTEILFFLNKLSHLIPPSPPSLLSVSMALPALGISCKWNL